jgi:uncharacterized protein (TIGR04222 family)
MPFTLFSMAILLAVIGLVGAPMTTVAALWARKLSLRAPEGAKSRVPDVYDLAYLAGGPERTIVALIEALVRGEVAAIDDVGHIRLAEDWAFGRGDMPEHAGLAAAVKLLADRGGSMPLPQLADALRRHLVTKESVARLRRQHLLLPAGYRPPVLPRALIALAGACGVAGVAWSAATDKTSGMVVGVIGVLLALGGWWLSSRLPRVPVTDAGHEILVEAYTHYRRGDVVDMAGHGAALRGADAIADPHLRERLTALEATRSGGWTWDPVTLPQGHRDARCLPDHEWSRRRAPLGSGLDQREHVHLPERAQRDQLARAVAAVGEDTLHDGHVGAAGQGGADGADVGHLVAADVGPLDVEDDAFGLLYDVVIEGGHARGAAVALALRVEDRGPDRVFDDGVGGEQGQPGLPVLASGCRLGRPGQFLDRRYALSHAESRTGSTNSGQAPGFGAATAIASTSTSWPV